MWDALRIDPESPRSTPDQIEVFVRERILTGDLVEGDKLPPTSELARCWHVNLSSVQKAMASLRVKGVLERKVRRGTFVRGAQEKVAVAVLAGFNALSNAYPYHSNLVDRLRQEARRRNWRLHFYDNIKATTQKDKSGAWEYQQFLREVRDYFLQGCVLVQLGYKQAKKIQKDTALQTVNCALADSEADLIYDYADFFRQSLEFFHQRNRHDLAAVCVPKHFWGNGTIQHSSYRMGNILSQDEMVDKCEGGEGEKNVYNAMRKAIQGWRAKNKWPDGILVGDDIAMRSVAMALFREQVPTDAFDIVTIANEGIDLFYGIPVTRYVLPVNVYAKAALDLIWKRMLGEDILSKPQLVRGSLQES